MKIFNTETDKWEIYETEEKLNKLVEKLDKQGIPYTRTSEGVFIEDEDEEKIDATN